MILKIYYLDISNFEILKNYWNDTFARQFLMGNALTADQFPCREMSCSQARQPGEIDAASPAGFLCQSGCLPLGSEKGGVYLLDYPNSEVRKAVSQLFMENITSDWGGASINPEGNGAPGWHPAISSAWQDP
jgi:hypothetical protein